MEQVGPLVTQVAGTLFPTPPISSIRVTTVDLELHVMLYWGSSHP